MYGREMHERRIHVAWTAIAMVTERCNTSFLIVYIDPQSFRVEYTIYKQARVNPSLCRAQDVCDTINAVLAQIMHRTPVWNLLILS